MLDARCALTTQEETAADVERLITTRDTNQQRWCQISLPDYVLRATETLIWIVENN